MITTATIFYIDEQMLEGRDDPFGVRYESQILPRGSVVVGFMTWNPTNGVQELLIPDFPFHPDQMKEWEQTIACAREVLLKG